VSAAGGAILVLAVATWRSAFLPVAAYLFLAAIGLHLWHHDTYVIRRPDLEITTTVTRLFSSASIRRIVAAYVLFVFAWQGTIGFLPVFLQAEKGLSTTVASAVFGLVYLIGGIAGPLAGLIGDRVGKLRTVVVVLGGALTGLSALIVAETFVSIGLSIIVLSVGFRSFFDISQAYLMDTFADDTMAGDLGAAKTVWSSLGSFGSTYVGWTAGWSSYAVAYSGLVACLLLSLSILLVVWYLSE
jgi:nitrate/nitrite transporter NarK